MSKKLEALRGMDDILPGEIEKWHWIEKHAGYFFESHGFKEVRTPILEFTELFTRSVGESSDIVSKEMFSFLDRGDRNITLRPEMTASVARSVIEHGLLSQAKSLRFYYKGPMFRAERPQAGRKRQFHQIGIEIVNESGADADFECIELLNGFLKEVGVAKPVIRINDLGDVATRERIVQGLKDYFQQQSSKLCKDCQWRLEKNVLRIFDCKVEACQPVIQAANWDQFAPLSPEFIKFTKRLEAAGILFEIKRRLVRGLDYYTGIVFEATAEGLGAQDALAGGGRYDGLYEELGGKATPCTGFSIGFERLLLTLENPQSSLSAAMGEETIMFFKLIKADHGLAHEISDFVNATVLKLRKLGFSAIDSGKISDKKDDHYKVAEKRSVRHAVILDEKGYAAKIWVVRDRTSKDEMQIKFYDSNQSGTGLHQHFLMKLKGHDLL